MNLKDNGALYGASGRNIESIQKRDKARKIIIYVLLIIWAFINLFPIYWMFTFSLKTNEEIFGENVAGLPHEWLWSNYADAMKTGNMKLYFLNSGIIAVSTILITLFTALMATYAMTRLIWKGRKKMNSFFMLGLTIPIHASIVPIYVTLSAISTLLMLLASRNAFEPMEVTPSGITTFWRAVQDTNA